MENNNEKMNNYSIENTCGVENKILFPKVSYLYENILLCLFSFSAAISSYGLLESELSYLADKDKALGCDLNPLIGCSSSLASWHSHLFFGISNSIVGMVVFTALFTIFILNFLKVYLPSIVWVISFIGSSLGVLWVLWFLWISAFTFKKLCPFCLVIWCSTIIIWAILLGIVSRNEFIFRGSTVNSFFCNLSFSYSSDNIFKHFSFLIIRYDGCLDACF